MRKGVVIFCFFLGLLTSGCKKKDVGEVAYCAGNMNKCNALVINFTIPVRSISFLILVNIEGKYLYITDMFMRFVGEEETYKNEMIFLDESEINSIINYRPLKMAVWDDMDNSIDGFGIRVLWLEEQKVYEYYIRGRIKKDWVQIFEAMFEAIVRKTKFEENKIYFQKILQKLEKEKEYC